MPTQLIVRIAAAGVIGLSFASVEADAAAMAYDDASAATYNLDWEDGQNGGFGFGPWTLTPNPENLGIAGHFVASSQPNGGDIKGNIDTAGRSWGLYANFQNILTDAVRPFTPGGITGDSTLGIGEQFIIRFDNGFVRSSGAVGFGLRNESGENRFEFYYGNGQSGYTLNIQDNVLTTHPVTYAGMTITFTLTGPDTFSLEVDYAEGSSSSETFNGTLEGTPGSGIDRFRLFNFAAGQDRTNVYFNSVQVVPEPSSMGLIAIGALVAAKRRRFQTR